MVCLKSGQLLAKKLEPKDLLEMSLEQPIFSPDLMLWKTSLNDHLIPTGSIGVNSDLVEKESDFPRFKILASMAETDEELLIRIKNRCEKLLKLLSTEKVFQVHELAVKKQYEEENRNKKHKESLGKSQQSSHGYTNQENTKLNNQKEIQEMRKGNSD